MTYKEWFESQQGIAYDSYWAFGRVAWGEQQKSIDELRAALVSAIDALSDFDYDKRMAAIAKCREVL